jgi:hypothetical protein
MYRQKKQIKSSRKRTMRHRGGSPASDRVMSFANAEGIKVATPETPKVAGDVSSLNLYQLTGGKRSKKYSKKTAKKSSKKNSKKSKKSEKASKRSKKSKRSNRRHLMKRGGGATDFRDTLYSRQYDGGRTDEAPFFNAFTNEEYISPQDLVNEPNMVANPPYLQ